MTALKPVIDQFAARLTESAPLNATLAWSRESLDAAAAQLSALPVSEHGPLHGVPVAIKDNIVTVDLPTTCASRILAGYTSPYDATVITRLRAAGALIACKTNLDEFAMGSSTEHSAFGRVHHPLDNARVPGGSSGGSAALVAAGVVPAALGSETGGSVRQPAAFCGVVGIKPTYGRVSRYGLVAFGSSLDAVSVFGRTLNDAIPVLTAISGQDCCDATSLPLEPIRPDAAMTSLRGVRIGKPAEYFPPDLDPGISAALSRVEAILRQQGATVVDCSLPHTRFAVPTYYIVAPAEASSNLARYDGVRYGLRVDSGGNIRAMYAATRGAGFGPEVRRRILVGTYVLSAGYYEAHYGKAQLARQRIAHDFTDVFADHVDFLLTPTTPTTAFRAGEKVDDPVAMYLADVFVCPANLAGVPALSLPAGRSDGLPVGAQLIAARGHDEQLLAVARLIEPLIDAQREVR